MIWSGSASTFFVILFIEIVITVLLQKLESTINFQKLINIKSCTVWIDRDFWHLQVTEKT